MVFCRGGFVLTYKRSGSCACVVADHLSYVKRRKPEIPVVPTCTYLLQYLSDGVNRLYAKLSFGENTDLRS